ncbi:MAG TPA: lycopene cyclase, partial [Planctomycetaceae bacterium]|nr:lycopene cyclase [Planctomycetaceae bacterium]
MPNATGKSFDYILVGGGLQSGLMAMAIRHHQPEARLAIVERESQIAGNHTWSFHATDVPAKSSAWVAPLIESRWPSYQILVGGRKRSVNLEYFSTSSAHFASVISHTLQGSDCEILTNATATELTGNRVTLHDGRQLDAAVVFDNRGPSRVDMQSYTGGFQKFWGFEILLENDWPIANPIVMDDRIDQRDGFRFVYTLPLERRRVLVEDTRFSNSPSIDRDECLDKVQTYLSDRGCRHYKIVREESGVLPMPTGGPLPGSELPKLAGGYRGGWFHAATGYSFPMSIAVAEIVATTPVENMPAVLQVLANEHLGRAKFARFLNRLLFDLVKPKTRYQIFRRFYRVLDESRIARFYGHRFTRTDAFRIVVGIPPMGL